MFSVNNLFDLRFFLSYPKELVHYNFLYFNLFFRACVTFKSYLFFYQPVILFIYFYLKKNKSTIETIMSKLIMIVRKKIKRFY